VVTTTYVLTGIVAVMALELWLLRRRIGQRLGALSRLEDELEVRISSLTRSLELLTDTTETGFNTIAAYLEASPLRSAPRAARQRRVTGAASTGRTVAEIAAQEELAETEVRLRLHMARQTTLQSQGRDAHGALRS
jgi:hypothetical protein